jgi:hypothetical protein
MPMAAQAIGFAAHSDHNFGDAKFQISGTATSQPPLGLAFTTASVVCTVCGNQTKSLGARCRRYLELLSCFSVCWRICELDPPH